MKLVEQVGSLGKWMGVEPAIDMLAKIGFDGLDLSLFDPIQLEWLEEPDMLTRARHLRDYAQERGISFVQAHAPFVFKYEQELDYQNQIRPLVEKAFAFAGELGIRHIVVHPLHHTQYYGNEARLFDWNLEFYSALAPAAKDAGVVIGIENMWQRSQKRGCIVPSFIGTSDEHSRFMDVLGEGPFTACVDLGHAALVGEEPEDYLRKMGKRVGCLHVQDTDYCSDMHVFPGMGRHNWDAICQALADIGYQGTLTYEANKTYNSFADPELFPAIAQLAYAQGRRLIGLIEKYASEAK